MRTLAVPALLLMAVATSGCEAGCSDAGFGDVVWHQAGAFAAAAAAPHHQWLNTTDNPWPLPAGHPLKERFGDGVLLRQVSMGEGEGGASAPFDVRPTFIHAGGDVTQLRRAVVALARHLAADPGEVDAWSQRHGVDALTTRSDPTPLDLELRVPEAAAEVAAGPVVEVQRYDLSIQQGNVVWSVAPDRIDVPAGNGMVSVLGGDWVRAPFSGDPADDAEAEGRAVAVAAAVGIARGPRDSVEIQAAQICA